MRHLGGLGGAAGVFGKHVGGAWDDSGRHLGVILVTFGSVLVTLGSILGTFCVPVPAFWRALGQLWLTWGPNVDLVGFRGPGHTPGVSRRQGHGDLWRDGKTPLGPRGSGFYLGNTHIQQNGGMYPSLSKSLK